VTNINPANRRTFIVSSPYFFAYVETNSFFPFQNLTSHPHPASEQD
jgi:hypothetical protein